MTDTERNELVDKVGEAMAHRHKDTKVYAEAKYVFGRDAQKVFAALESLGYEIVKKPVHVPYVRSPEAREAVRKMHAGEPLSDTDRNWIDRVLFAEYLSRPPFRSVDAPYGIQIEKLSQNIMDNYYPWLISEEKLKEQEALLKSIPLPGPLPKPPDESEPPVSAVQ